MSTRIIIEKDGERYACEGLTIETHNKSIICVSDGIECAMASYVKMPPVIRTDNSEVIARLEADKKRLHEATIHLNRSIERRDAQIRVLQKENAKLREALKPIMECDVDNINLHGHMYPVSVIERISKSVGAVRKAQAIMKGGAK